MRDKMDFEGKIRSVEKRGVDGMDVESGGDGGRRDSREKWGWRTEVEFGKRGGTELGKMECD